MSDVRVMFGPDAFRQRHGGVSRYFVNLHRELLDLGVRSRIFAGLHDNAYLQDASRVVGVRTAEFRGARRLTRAVLYPALRPSLRRRRIYHNTWYLPPFPAFGNRIAVTVHDLTAVRLPRHFGVTETERVRQEQARWCQAADVVFAVSHDTKSDVVGMLGGARGQGLRHSAGRRPADHLTSGAWCPGGNRDGCSTWAGATGTRTGRC